MFGAVDISTGIRWFLSSMSGVSATQMGCQVQAQVQAEIGCFGMRGPIAFLDNKKLLGTSASLLVTSALLVVTRMLLGAPGIATRSIPSEETTDSEGRRVEE